MAERTYRIGDVAKLLNLKTYVLRFWETEFPQLNPIRTEKGQRLYRKKDVALVRHICHLLYDRGLTIEGARRVLREEASPSDTDTSSSDNEHTRQQPAVVTPCDCGGNVQTIVTELELLRRMLSDEADSIDGMKQR